MTSILHLRQNESGTSSFSKIGYMLPSLTPTSVLRRPDRDLGCLAPFVLSIDHDDSGELLMTSASDETIQLWNIKDGHHMKSLPSKKYGVKLAKFTHHSSSIVFASTKQNNAIRYLATQNNSFIRYFEGHESNVTSLAVHPGRDQFISCSEDHTLRLWNTQTRHCVGMLFLRYPVLAAFDPSGTVFGVVCAESGSLLLYDLRKYDRAPFAVIDIVKQCRVFDNRIALRKWTRLEFSNDGKALLLGTDGNGHLLMDAFDGALQAFMRKTLVDADGTNYEDKPHLSQSSCNGKTEVYSRDCCFTPDGSHVLSGFGRNVLVWECLESVQSMSREVAPKLTMVNCQSISKVSFNPTYNLLATADRDVTLWIPEQVGGK